MAFSIAMPSWLLESLVTTVISLFESTIVIFVSLDIWFSPILYIVVSLYVSGMKEMLGEHDEYGVVTENDEDALYSGIKKILDNPELLEFYKKQAIIRGKTFNTENTVKAVEDMIS